MSIQIQTNIFRQSDFVIGDCIEKDVGKWWNHDWHKDMPDFHQYRIWYMKKGRGDIETLNEHFEIVAGRCYLLPPFSLLKTTMVEPIRQAYIHFQTNAPLIPLLGNKMKSVPISAVPSFDKHFKTLIKRSKVDTLGDYLLSQAALMSILSAFFKDISYNTKPENDLYSIIEYIDQNLGSDLSVKKLSELLHFNTNYFSNMFTKIFGVSPKSYIITKRLQQSQILLKTTTKTVKEISILLGFESDAYFTKLFRSKTGLTPSQYRMKSALFK